MKNHMTTTRVRRAAMAAHPALAPNFWYTHLFAFCEKIYHHTQFFLYLFSFFLIFQALYI